MTKHVPATLALVGDLFDGCGAGTSGLTDAAFDEVAHIAVGRGRDYSDVPPVKGIGAGTADANMVVAARMIRTS